MPCFGREPPATTNRKAFKDTASPNQKLSNRQAKQQPEKNKRQANKANKQTNKERRK